jgi:hypothetical protein
MLSPLMIGWVSEISGPPPAAIWVVTPPLTA